MGNCFWDILGINFTTKNVFRMFLTMKSSSGRYSLVLSVDISIIFCCA